jgi:hypothetical protein
MFQNGTDKALTVDGKGPMHRGHPLAIGVKRVFGQAGQGLL